jgi:hypothetical protein
MLGANPTATNSAIQMALPMILSGLAKNAQQPAGAEELTNALQQDHSGGILNNLNNYLNNPNSNEGIGILGHIFGGKQGGATKQVSEQSGLDIGQVAQLLIVLAPIVMGYLGKKRQQENLDANGVSQFLGEQQEQMQATGNPMMQMISGFLDQNQDGNMMDDLSAMAMNYFNKR